MRGQGTYGVGWRGWRGAVGASWWCVWRGAGDGQRERARSTVNPWARRGGDRLPRVLRRVDGCAGALDVALKGRVGARQAPGRARELDEVLLLLLVGKRPGHDEQVAPELQLRVSPDKRRARAQPPSTHANEPIALSPLTLLLNPEEPQKKSFCSPLPPLPPSTL